VFSPDGNVLYVLDYVPAARPQCFRVRAIDLTTRQRSSSWWRSNCGTCIGVLTFIEGRPVAEAVRAGVLVFGASFVALPKMIERR
jgi:hypothetical protein